MLDSYIAWQKQQNIRLFECGNTSWRLYRGMLVPASLKPQPIQLDPSDARKLLAESRAHLARFYTRTSTAPTEFWYVECGEYDFEKLSPKLRKNIRRAHRDSCVRRIEPNWLAEHAYPCYSAAFSRYKSGAPKSDEAFRQECLSCASGPFEFWGAFVDDSLAAFAKCVVGDDYVTMVAFKFDPRFSSTNSTYALLDTILQAYVAEQHKPVNNGARSLDHDTQMQDFVAKFGFRCIYTDLQVIYRPPLGSLIGLLYPFSSLIDCLTLPRPAAALKTLLRQEQIRRSCLQLTA